MLRSSSRHIVFRSQAPYHRFRPAPSRCCSLRFSGFRPEKSQLSLRPPSSRYYQRLDPSDVSAPIATEFAGVSSGHCVSSSFDHPTNPQIRQTTTVTVGGSSKTGTEPPIYSLPSAAGVLRFYCVTNRWRFRYHCILLIPLDLCDRQVRGLLRFALPLPTNMISVLVRQATLPRFCLPET